MNHIWVLFVMLATVALPARAGNPIRATNSPLTTLSAVLGGWASAIGRTLVWEVPSAYDRQFVMPTDASDPLSGDEFKQALRALNDYLTKALPPGTGLPREQLVVCVRDNYVAVRLSRQPTASCPDSTQNGDR